MAIAAVKEFLSSPLDACLGDHFDSSRLRLRFYVKLQMTCMNHVSTCFSSIVVSKIIEGAHEVCIFQIPTCLSLWPRANVFDVFSKENQDCCVGELGSSINHKIGFEDTNTCPEDQILQRLSLLFDSFIKVYTCTVKKCIQYRVFCHPHVEHLYVQGTMRQQKRPVWVQGIHIDILT